MTMMRTAAALATSVVFASKPTAAFHLLGIHPKSFKSDDNVPMKVNSMTSMHTQMPFDYYALPFCQPEGGPKMASENLGEFLAGSKVESSPYVISMGRDTFCQIICQAKLDKMEAHMFQILVKRGYHNNWIIDNLPSASIGLEDADGVKHVNYAGGFPIGFVAPKPGVDAKEIEEERFTPNREFWKKEDAYVYNHANLYIDYHPLGDGDHRVVGFGVEPMSVKHRYSQSDFVWDGSSAEGFAKPLQSCPSGIGIHMDRKYVRENQIIAPDETILFTYDVIWRESDTEWASRWDIYLTDDNLVPAKVHWQAVVNSFGVVLFLGMLVIGILVRNLRRDIDAYNNAALKMLADEEEEDEDEAGWKLVHADVFRPPSNRPMLLCVLVGSGVQLAITALLSIVLAAIGFLSPARRGSFMIAILVAYMLCGSAAGYVSSRLHKAIQGKKWQLCTILVSMLFPGLCFALFLFFNVILFFFHSSGSVPFVDVLTLIVMWCCVSIPLVYVGSFVGYKQETISFPTRTSSVARAIPEPTSFLSNAKFAICAAGCIPFSAAYVEYFFIMQSLW
eukprot:CAMPEP_0195520288 /NCGR_PEP_ID=MMETSP0794_2-20130614/16545_1 /TAXON_ID=515487 /ORGANISM="Stephanopyxis turris, Strain CCMP 815" /LENGTH=561 /DNA_ID=CAMNT_0040649615 /DNA_START=59 /DNA_END=1741 /DNA_ORIENTATION=+